LILRFLGCLRVRCERAPTNRIVELRIFLSALAK
jgi:hypothetical protein